LGGGQAILEQGVIGHIAGSTLMPRMEEIFQNMFAGEWLIKNDIKVLSARIHVMCADFGDSAAVFILQSAV